MKEWFAKLVKHIKDNRVDIARRAIKTFFQAFLACLPVSSLLEDDMSAATSVLIGALAAGISAVWNAFLPSILEWIDKLWKEEEKGEDDDGNSET